MKLLRKLLGGISLTAAMFVFQACYGTEYSDDGPQTGFTLRVVEAKDGQPIPGIKVETRWQDRPDNNFTSCSSWYTQGLTDSAGLISVEMPGWIDYLKVHFTDDDSVYAAKDTVLSEFNYDTVDIVLRRMNQ